MSITDLLNKELKVIFKELNYNENYAIFQYSDRPDLGDFQTNCAMQLCKILHIKPQIIAENIVEKLNKLEYFDSVSIANPAFINVKIKDSVLLNNLNSTIIDEKNGYKHKEKQKRVVIDFGGYNIAKEPHVGHLRSTSIGESIRRIYEFCGDSVIGDTHLGDWGLPMGMVIEGIRLKYPEAKCFKDNFDGDKIDDLNLTAGELTEIYRLASAKSKEDKYFDEKVHESVVRLQNGYKPYLTLWKYFTNISINDLKEIAEDILKAHFDIWNGESSVNDLIKIMLRNLDSQGFITESQGAKIIDISDKDDTIPPVIVKNKNGAAMYITSDLATILDRLQKFNPDLILYVVDVRQSLYFKQVFLAGEKIGFLNEKHKAEHCGFGTMNGKDNKPYKTRSGEVVKLRDLINDVKTVIAEKSKNANEKTIDNIAVACIKFADLINYRESNYIFDLEQFTNYEGKTGAYLLYSIVRINSILADKEKFDYKITTLNTKEERDLVIDLSKFSDVIAGSYNKKAPNFLAEYVYNLAKKFNTFYSSCSINKETDEEYKKSKISLIYLTKKYIETCIYLLGIDNVDRM